MKHSIYGGYHRFYGDKHFKANVLEVIKQFELPEHAYVVEKKYVGIANIPDPGERSLEFLGVKDLYERVLQAAVFTGLKYLHINIFKNDLKHIKKLVKPLFQLTGEPSFTWTHNYPYVHNEYIIITVYADIVNNPVITSSDKNGVVIEAQFGDSDGVYIISKNYEHMLHLWRTGKLAFKLAHNKI